MLGQLIPEVGDISGHIRGQEPGLGWEALWVVGFLLTHTCPEFSIYSFICSLSIAGMAPLAHIMLLSFLCGKMLKHCPLLGVFFLLPLPYPSSRASLGITS